LKRNQKLKDKELKQPPPTTPKRYGVVFYETFQAAKSDVENLSQKKSAFDQLNVVIRAEGNMDDPDLLRYGKVFAGAAWYLIHERRAQDGWYDKPQ